jgi:hypothetical protein
MKYTPMLLVAALSFAACSKQPHTGQASKPLAAKPTGELTRELAAQLLNQHIATPHVWCISFKEGGLENAIRDGVVLPERDAINNYHFSDKGFALAGGFIKKTTPIRKGKDIFIQKTPIGERILEVTGISLPSVSNTCEAEYTTDYLFPKEAEALRKYLYTGQRAKASFRKYDDGWRVAE